jgi:hypothetical protein
LKKEIFNDDFYGKHDYELDEKVDQDGKPIFSDDEEYLMGLYFILYDHKMCSFEENNK